MVVKPDHVTASPTASPRLGEPIGDRSWEVVVDWGINCRNAEAPTYGGSLYLVDQVTGEQIYLGEGRSPRRARTPRW